MVVLLESKNRRQEEATSKSVAKKNSDKRAVPFKAIRVKKIINIFCPRAKQP